MGIRNIKNFSQFKSLVFPPEKLLIDPYLGRFYRPFSLRLSWILYRTKITPNFVTVLQIIIGLFSCLFISVNLSKEAMLLGVIVLHFAYLLDCVDGEIARAKQMDSLEGLFLDKFAHAITMPSIFMAVTLHYSEFATNLSFPLLVISFFSSLCTFNPVNRLITSIVQQLMTKKQFKQYDLEQYQKNKITKNENEVIEFVEDELFIAKKKKKIKKIIKSSLFKFGKQFFRHVTYLFYITVLVFLEFIHVPPIILISLWLILVLLVISKEILGLYLVLFKNIIMKRYLKTISKTQFINENN